MNTTVLLLHELFVVDRNHLNLAKEWYMLRSELICRLLFYCCSWKHAVRKIELCSSLELIGN